MSKKALLILLAIIVIAAFAGIYYSRSQIGGGPEGTLTSFSVSKPNFVAEGSNLAIVEVWMIPTGTNVSEDSYTKVGDMVLASDNNGMEQMWTLPIPENPLLATEIFAKAFGKSGNEVGRISLPAKGVTELYNSLWGNPEEQSFSLKVGEKLTYKDITLELVKIASDSRCPVNANCIQAGDVTLEVKLTSGGNTTTETLSMAKNPFKYKSYYVEITKVDPSKKVNETVAQKDYVVTFTISTDIKG